MSGILAVLGAAVAVPAMSGPYNDLTQVCAPCTTTAQVKNPGAPLRELRVIFAGDASVMPTPSNQLRHWLAIRTDAGWFLQDLGFSGVICGGRSQSSVSLSASGLAAKDVLGDAAPEVSLDVDTDVIGGGPQIRDRKHYVCALGSNGTPRCAELFVRRYADRVEDSWDYTLTVTRAGAVHMTKDSYGHADTDLTLAFP
jgi:hypothetical protein